MSGAFAPPSSGAPGGPGGPGAGTGGPGAGTGGPSGSTATGRGTRIAVCLLLGAVSSFVVAGLAFSAVGAWLDSMPAEQVCARWSCGEGAGFAMLVVSVAGFLAGLVVHTVVVSIALAARPTWSSGFLALVIVGVLLLLAIVGVDLAVLKALGPTPTP